MTSHPATQAGTPDGTGFGRKLKRCFLGLGVLAGLLAIGCTQGSYPVDIFYEMHYQQSYKAQEPPSLSAPADSVSWFPPPQSTSFKSGRHLYTINCSMCHGAGGQGDGPVVQTLKETYGYKPVVDPPIVTDNPIDNILLILGSETLFFGPDSVMPPFGKLLSDEERRTIAEYIDTLPVPRPTATPVAEEPTPAPVPTQPPDVDLAGGSDHRGKRRRLGVRQSQL